jgi:hypothetical protein
LATTSQIPTGAALTKADDTNVTLTLGGSPNTSLINAASITAGWTGQLGLTRGGTAASLTASNGGIVYTSSSAMAILAGTATAGQIIRSGASAAPSWSTATYPNTFTINDIPYASAANVLGVITASSNAILAYNGSSVPAATQTLPSAVQNNITAVNSAANTLSIGGSTKTFTSGSANIPTFSAIQTFNAGIAFGGASVGITYSNQQCFYRTITYPNATIETQVWGIVSLSNKGSSTGNATLTGLPTPSGSNGGFNYVPFIPGNITVASGAIPFLQIQNSSTSANIDTTNYNGGGYAQVTNTAFANTSAIGFNFSYLNN